MKKILIKLLYKLSSNVDTNCLQNILHVKSKMWNNVYTMFPLGKGIHISGGIQIHQEDSQDSAYNHS